MKLKYRKFQHDIYNYYRKNKRSFPWRNTEDPYEILVSEFMLQQTQTARVEKKYPEFLKLFPNFKSLAEAQLSDVLIAWQGLGYNRRAISLKKVATIVMTEYQGKLPDTQESLEKLPGIGKSTAGAVCAFAFNKAYTFIETNIRSVYIHYFFRDSSSVSDKEISVITSETLDLKNPRDWYYALMDYGVKLKKDIGNVSQKSSLYSKQSPFIGSHREKRSKILKLILALPFISTQDISTKLKLSKQTVHSIVSSLLKEGFLEKKDGKYKILDKKHMGTQTDIM